MGVPQTDSFERSCLVDPVGVHLNRTAYARVDLEADTQRHVPIIGLANSLRM